jgi:hypothetical protein
MSGSERTATKLCVEGALSMAGHGHTGRTTEAHLSVA